MARQRYFVVLAVFELPGVAPDMVLLVPEPVPELVPEADVSLLPSPLVVDPLVPPVELLVPPVPLPVVPLELLPPVPLDIPLVEPAEEPIDPLVPPEALDDPLGLVSLEEVEPDDDEEGK